ncbi:helix-turn-helix transcriptional regulator [Nocardia sp. NPDC052001]|uniref:helix-turn-helix domain-containing protein n=1 Tax=Nocardia sp. NPDC052001 TaxID=3154853 RepID=UPI003421FFC8
MARGEGDLTNEPDRRQPSVADQLAREIKRFRREAGISQRVLASKIGYSRQYVTLTEWENSSLPSREIVAAIDGALGAAGALVTLRAHADDDRQARRHTDAGSLGAPTVPCKTLTANVFSPFDLEAVPDRYVPEPCGTGRVALSDVERVRDATRHAAATENLSGGGPANTLASRQLYELAPLVRGRGAPETRRAMFEAVGNLGGVAAFAAFDIADFSTAEQHSRFAPLVRRRRRILGTAGKRARRYGSDDGLYQRC